MYFRLFRVISVFLLGAFFSDLDNDVMSTCGRGGGGGVGSVDRALDWMRSWVRIPPGAQEKN